MPEDYLIKSNYLFNLQLLAGKENNEKRAQNPKEWIANYCDSDSEKIREYKKNNYIDEQHDLSWEKIAEFDKSRIKNILTKLHKMFETDK